MRFLDPYRNSYIHIFSRFVFFFHVMMKLKLIIETISIMKLFMIYSEVWKRLNISSVSKFLYFRNPLQPWHCVVELFGVAFV